jgi:hypothetical protein
MRGVSISGFDVQVLRRVTPDWERAERELQESGIPAPLWTASSWARATATPTWLVSVHEPGSRRCVGALALEVERTRALPGHRLMRARHLGTGCLAEAGAALLAAVRDLSHSEPRVLRLSLEWILRTEEEQRSATTLLRTAAFVPTPHPRNYRETLVIPLGGTEEELLAGFSATTRRDLRGWAQRPVEMRPITDARYTDRLNLISRETFGRTGGAWRPRPWAERIALCAAVPDRSRLVGLFRAGRNDDEALLAYAWGCVHGAYAQYDDAGSTRVDDIKVSMMYPIMWDLIRWAKASGCAWFDLGGVTAEGRAADDPRAGISEFKRRFSKEVAAVGMEWEYEPHPARARLARGLARLVRRA